MPISVSVENITIKLNDDCFMMTKEDENDPHVPLALIYLI